MMIWQTIAEQQERVIEELVELCNTILSQLSQFKNIEICNTTGSKQCQNL